MPYFNIHAPIRVTTYLNFSFFGDYIVWPKHLKTGRLPLRYVDTRHLLVVAMVGMAVLLLANDSFTGATFNIKPYGATTTPDSLALVACCLDCGDTSTCYTRIDGRKTMILPPCNTPLLRCSL